MKIKTTDTFSDSHGRRWWVGVDPATGKAWIATSHGGPSSHYDLDNDTRLALVRALSGEGD
jgi:hypothetical protein